MSAPRLTDQQKATITELREEKGLSYQRIGDVVGMSPGSVAWYCLKEGIEPPVPGKLPEVPIAEVAVQRGGHIVRRFTQADDARLLELEAEGLPVAKIAHALGRRWNSVRGRLMTLARRDERMEAAQ